MNITCNTNIEELEGLELLIRDVVDKPQPVKVKELRNSLGYYTRHKSPYVQWEVYQLISRGVAESWQHEIHAELEECQLKFYQTCNLSTFELEEPWKEHEVERTRYLLTREAELKKVSAATRRNNAKGIHERKHALNSMVDSAVNKGSW
jgi:hypothetical protein